MGGKIMQGREVSRKEVMEIVRDLLRALGRSVRRVEICGGFRRGKEAMSDIDLVVIPRSQAELNRKLDEIFGEFSDPDRVRRTGAIRGVQIDVWITTSPAWGACVMTATGPDTYNIAKRALAKKRGMLLSEYGVFDRGTRRYLGGRTEREVTRVVGFTMRPPEDRR